MTDPITAAIIMGSIVGATGIGNIATQAIAAEKADKRAKEAQELADKQFAAEQAELERQKAKEEATTQANVGALDSVFGEKKKKKSVDEMYFGDI